MDEKVKNEGPKVLLTQGEDGKSIMSARAGWWRLSMYISF
jgi:hypothetical protein